MVIGVFKKSESQPKSKVEQRVSKIATPDLTTWADQALYGIGRHLSSWQSNASVADLEEAEMGAEALLAVVRELKARSLTR